MKKGQPDGSAQPESRMPPEGRVHPQQLLNLWMGDKQEAGSRRQPLPTGLVVALAAGGAIALLLLAKYALDVLTILLALAAVGLVLHVLGLRLAESDILSPGWFLIIVLGVALFAYAFFVPAQSVAGLSRYMPKWMVAGLEWSESHGWGQRALTGPGDSGTAPAPVAGTAGSPSGTEASTSATPAPSVMLTSSSPTSLQGQPVTLMARMAGTDAAPGRVVFYDGSLLLGTAEVKSEGRVWIAYLTVRGLAVGEHEIRAELVGPLGGRGGQRSEPLRHMVLRRPR